MTRPTPSSPSRPHGLVPRFRYGYTDQHIRVSDAERTEMADRLQEGRGHRRDLPTYSISLNQDEDRLLDSPPEHSG
jgi:hypothetical protein